PRITDPTPAVNGCLEIFNNGAGFYYAKIYDGFSWTKLSVNGMYADSAQASTVGGVETDLHSYTIPANTLSIDGESIAFKCAGTCEAVPMVFRAYLGGSLIFDSGTLAAFTDATNWDFRGWIIRVDANNQKCTG